ncbi:MAG: efflux RND transporter periplasmic adaptor subunit [Lachnospiraceae bacterium]|nr:efflux RND transporter periplasmic adaptor subunit [Lachnospiraceae bacterium]
MKRRIKLCAILLASSMLCFSACTNKEDVPLVIVDSEDDVVSFNLIPVTYDDVVLNGKMDCTYVQTNSQEVSFNQTGKYVDKVYVKEGEKVTKGTLLCELSSDALQTSIDELEYKIKRNELLLSYSENNERLAIQDRWVSRLSNAYDSDEKAKEDVVTIQSQYASERELLNDYLEFDRQDLAKKKSELKASRLYASMDGKVFKLKDNLEGSTSKAGTVIMTIVDDSNCLFSSKNIEYKDLFKEGVAVDMKIIYSSAAGDYLVMPYEKESWTDTMLFSIYDGPDNSEIEMGTMGTISVEIEKKEHVLSVPKDTVHQAGDKYFVYTLTEENVREIRYIEAGLVGDERVEIISGLSEGEKVLKK